MADAHALGACAARRAGSNPASPTKRKSGLCGGIAPGLRRDLTATLTATGTGNQSLALTATAVCRWVLTASRRCRRIDETSLERGQAERAIGEPVPSHGEHDAADASVDRRLGGLVQIGVPPSALSRDARIKSDSPP